MKTIITSLAILVTAIFASDAAGTNDNLWVAISPNLTANQLHTFCDAEFNWLLKAPANTHIRFIDGLSLESFSDITIPDVQNSKGRVKALQSEVQKIVNWVKATAGHPNTDGNVDLPGILRSISPDVNRNTSVLVVGSPIYESSDEPGFSFFSPNETNPDARFRRPAHCHLFATPAESPFGTKGMTTELGSGDTEVFWLIPDQTKLGNTLFRVELENFWAVYIQMVGGSMVAWDSDTDRMLDRVLEAGLTPIAGHLHQEETSFEMLSVARDSGSKRVVVQEPAPITMQNVEGKPISDFIIVDRTGSMGGYIGTVRNKILQLPNQAQKNYALIFFDDHDVEKIPAVLACEGKSLEEIAHRVEVEPLHGSIDIPEALEDAVGLAHEIIIKRHLKNVNLYIFTDAPAKSYCPLGYDYATEVKELIDEGHSVYLADMHVKIYNQLPGTHIF